jgi:hypothetical protein
VVPGSSQRFPEIWGTGSPSYRDFVPRGGTDPGLDWPGDRFRFPKAGNCLARWARIGLGGPTVQEGERRDENEMTVLLPRKDLPRDFVEDEDRASERRANPLDRRMIWDVVDADREAGGKGLSLLVVLERAIRRDPGMGIRAFADAVVSLRVTGHLEQGRGPGYRLGIPDDLEAEDRPRAFFAEPRTAGEIDLRRGESLQGPPDGEEELSEDSAGPGRGHGRGKVETGNLLEAEALVEADGPTRTFEDLISEAAGEDDGKSGTRVLAVEGEPDQVPDELRRLNED